MLLSAGFLVLSDNSEATDTEKQVSVTVTAPDSVTGTVDDLAVAFVNSSHYVVCHVSNGQCTPTLKIGLTYTVSCFNVKMNGANLVPVFQGEGDRGTMMDYVHYGKLAVTESTGEYTVNMEKGVEYTDSNGNLYYTYSSGFATLVRLGVQFEENVVSLNGVDTEVWQVKSDQTLTIPEKVNNCDVVFIGANMNTTKSLIYVDESYPVSDKTYTDAMFRGPVSNTLNIVFEGSVILNTQPFTKPHGDSNGTPAQDQSCDRFNFNIVFKKDVYVNSYGIYKASTQKCNLTSCTDSLTGIGDVTIEGIYHGAYEGSWSKTNNTPSSGTPSVKIGQMALNNCGINVITLANGLILKDGTDLANSEIACLGLLSGNEYTVTPVGEEYSLSIGSTVANGDIANVFNNLTDPFLITTFINGEPSYTLVSAGASKTLDDPVVEGYEFAGWFTDAEYQHQCTQATFTESATVYAKFSVKQFVVTVAGDGIEVRDGNAIVNSGTALDYGTELVIVASERIGYTPVLKLDGAILSGNAITVPARNITISCEWAAVEYTVKCVDGTTLIQPIANCHLGDVITLPTAPAKADMNFNGWKINDGLMLGAQYVVDYRDAGEGDVITLTADYSAVVKTTWSLTVTGADGKAFWTTTNAIGTYGMITVLPDEFETVKYTVSDNGGYGIISDNCAMVYSTDGNDVTVTVEFKDVGKASEYDVSVAEIASGDKHGFKATVTAKDGYVDSAGKFAISYVYKTWNDTDKVWIYTTSGVTEGVENATVTIPTDKKVSSVTGEFLLDNDSAMLVFGFATFSFKGTSVTGIEEDVTVHSPVIMCVSEIQAVVGKP